MKLKAVGHRVIVRPDEVEKQTKGGIILNLAKDEKRLEAAQHRGVIVDIGPNAWKGFDDGQPWAETGDRVYFVKHAGQMVEDEETGELFRLLNDDDIVAKVEA